MSVRIPVVRVRDPEARLPQYETSKAAGMDLRADIPAPLTLAPYERKLVPTGVAMTIPDGYEGQVRPRSGLALRHGVTVLNSPGTIDGDFTGEIGVVLINFGHDPFTVSPGDRIAQLVIAPVARAELCPVDALDETRRGPGGYGSTGR